jgi:hypothetical protein
MVYTIVVHLYAKADEESISKLKAKLVEASQVYSKDKETLSWFVMQDTVDARKFTIVERYQQESVSSSPVVTRLRCRCMRLTRRIQCSHSNTTSTTPTGRPSTPTFFRCSMRPWTCADSRRWIRALRVPERTTTLIL